MIPLAALYLATVIVFLVAMERRERRVQAERSHLLTRIQRPELVTVEAPPIPDDEQRQTIQDEYDLVATIQNTPPDNGDGN